MSALDDLRARRESLRKDRTIDLPIPGWDGLLTARYGTPGHGEAEQIRSGAVRLAAEGRDDAELAAAADVLILLCRELLAPGDDGELVPLGQLADETGPVRFDERLASHLGFDAPTARACVYGVFPQDSGGVVLDFTVVAHARRVIRWLEMIDREADDTVAGEA